MTRAAHRLLGLCLALVACGPDVPEPWTKLVPRDDLVAVFGAEVSGNTKRLKLHYTQQAVSAKELRGRFIGTLETGGYTDIMLCEHPFDQSDVFYMNDAKDVVLIGIRKHGDDYWEAVAEKVIDTPHNVLSGEGCKLTEFADKYCTATPEGDCRFRS